MENGVQLHHGRLQDENAGLGPVLNNKPLQQSSGPLKAGPLSARKAFGNITNKAGGGAAENGGGGGGPGGAAPKPRRAFGELSVNRPAQQHAAGPQQDAAKPSRAPLAPQQAAAATAAAAQPSDRAARYAAGGVEGYAGKPARDLDEEREDEEDAAAAAAARQLAARLAAWRPGGVLRVAADDDDEADATLLAPQHTKPRAPAAPARRSSPDPLACLADSDIFGSPGPSGAACAADLLPELPAAADCGGGGSGSGASPAAGGGWAGGAPAAGGGAGAWSPCSPDAQPW
ncbi:MAG: hypothetical protein J3K34DRAFT_526550 [Monoraphidium minutum]|nr:MAG: hypothetical protein J3K34DRAFT_526550 [Monoraphidium minutum]